MLNSSTKASKVLLIKATIVIVSRLQKHRRKTFICEICNSVYHCHNGLRLHTATHGPRPADVMADSSFEANGDKVLKNNFENHDNTNSEPSKLYGPSANGKGFVV